MTVFGRLQPGARTTKSSALSMVALVGALVLGGALVGLVVVDMPKKAVAAAAIFSTGVVALSLPTLFPWIFIRAMGLILLGYICGGRAFAHLGVPPIFIGELTLALGLLAALTTPQRWTALRSPIGKLYLVFAAWCAVRAAYAFPTYGLDTLRDSVIWGYGVFALLVPAFLVRPNWIPRFLQRYARLFPIVLAWLPVGLVVSYAFSDLLPVANDFGGDSMGFVKPGDGGIHLAGAAAFLLLGLHRAPGVRARAGFLGNEWVMGAICIAGFFCVTVLGRGGAMAIVAALGAVLVIRPLVALPKLTLVGGGAVVAALVLLASNFTIEMGRRDLSAEQLTSNLLSVVGDDVDQSQVNLEQTKNWRLRWWTKIVDYTVHGPYFWTGKGFGVNLAIDDGIRKETFNRHPHSAHMSILARAGVPGLTLWILLQTAFGASLLAAFLRATRMGEEWWARLDLWVLAYWLAFITAASFGVYLEGPHGGIPFWCVMGLGISVLLTQEQALRTPAPLPSRSGHAAQAAARS